MLKKNLKKIEKRKNKREKDKKKAAERLRELPRSRQDENFNEKKVEKLSSYAVLVMMICNLSCDLCGQ